MGVNKIWWKKIHNWLGIASALFLLILLVTGILLNHPDWLKSKDENEVVVAHPAQPEKLLAGRRDGLFESLDGGKRWEEVSMLYPPQEVADITFSPKNSKEIYLLEKWGKIFFSADGGKIWETFSLPFDPQSEGIELKKISLGANQNLILFTSHGWLSTKDKGQSWDQTHFDASQMPLHRLIVTLHNGYFFGPAFVWLYDFSAIALFIVILSGFILWNIGRTSG